MDTKEKYTIIEKVMKTEDEAVLNQIKEILEFNEETFWKDINSALKASLERGLDQSDRQEGIPHEEVMSSLKTRRRI
ncbi:MAG: hypothetical protein JJE09_03675 [Bacteroidia bacterium]|nr:hypothetical protein [Bacteroidia bacterium]